MSTYKTNKNPTFADHATETARPSIHHAPNNAPSPRPPPPRTNFKLFHLIGQSVQPPTPVSAAEAAMSNPQRSKQAKRKAKQNSSREVYSLMRRHSRNNSKHQRIRHRVSV